MSGNNKPIIGPYARVCCVRTCPVCGADCALVANTKRAQYECTTGEHFFENNKGDIGQQKE